MPRPKNPLQFHHLRSWKCLFFPFSYARHTKGGGLLPLKKGVLKHYEVSVNFSKLFSLNWRQIPENGQGGEDILDFTYILIAKLPLMVIRAFVMHFSYWTGDENAQKVISWCFGWVALSFCRRYGARIQDLELRSCKKGPARLEIPFNRGLF